MEQVSTGASGPGWAWGRGEGVLFRKKVEILPEKHRKENKVGFLRFFLDFGNLT